MAKLYTEIHTNRMDRKFVDPVHRLGDTWVQAHVQNWDVQITVTLDDAGALQISARNLRNGKLNLLFNEQIANALSWHLREVVQDDFKPRPEPEDVLVTTE